MNYKMLKRKTITQQMREQLTKSYMTWGFSYQRTRDAILTKRKSVN